MIGNRIQSLYLSDRNYPEAAALSFLMMAAILIVVLVYIRAAGTEAFMGEEEEAAIAASRQLAATKRDHDLRRVRGRLHADPDRRDRRLLVRRDPARPAQLLPRRRLHARVLEERVLDPGAERRDARYRSSWRR